MSSRSIGVGASDRRRFLKLVGIAGLSSAVGTAMAAWAEPRTAADVLAAAAPSAPADTTGSGAAAATSIAADGRDLLAIVQRRYGQHLSPKQLEAITQEIEGRLQGGKRLRAVKLANSDEPDFVFRV